MITAKKSIIALALVAPLSLAACSSDENTDAGSTTVTSANGAAPAGEGNANDAQKDAAAASSGAAAPSAAEQQDGDAAGPQTGDQPEAGADGQTPETLVNPFDGENNPLQGDNAQPLETGGAADEATINEIRALNEGLYNTTTLRQFSKYIPDHTCKRVLDQQEENLAEYDYNQIPDFPMDNLGVNWSQTNVDSVQDVKVDGNVASATVVVNSPNGQESSTMRFEREDGAWKYCQ